MSTSHENMSSDVLWEVVRKQNAYLVKRKQAGGVHFSRDPLNLANKHSRKHEGFVNATAVGIQPDSNTITLTTKVASRGNKPAAMYQTASFAANTPTRKLYKAIVSSTAKKGYRADLRAQAVARASAVRQMQREKKGGERERKLRGSKARKAKAAETS